MLKKWGWWQGFLKGEKVQVHRCPVSTTQCVPLYGRVCMGLCMYVEHVCEYMDM